MGIGCSYLYYYNPFQKEAVLRCKLWCHLWCHVSVLCNWSPYSARARSSVKNRTIYKVYARVPFQPTLQNKTCYLKYSIPCILILSYTSITTPAKCTITYIYIYIYIYLLCFSYMFRCCLHHLQGVLCLLSFKLRTVNRLYTHCTI